MTTRIRYFLTLAAACMFTTEIAAAINPEEYKRIASDVFRLREVARVIDTDEAAKPSRQRITIVAEIVEVKRSSTPRSPSEIIVVDYRVNLEALNAAREKFNAKPAMPGPQFLHEPDAPKLDEQGQFVAYLAPAAKRLANVNRYAGAEVDFQSKNFSGPVFVPVAAQYSFELPQR